MQLPMIGTMEIDSGKSIHCFKDHVRKFFSRLVYENGNHSTFHEDDECDSSANPGKISLDEDLLPATTLPADEEEDEPGKSTWNENKG